MTGAGTAIILRDSVSSHNVQTYLRSFIPLLISGSVVVISHIQMASMLVRGRTRIRSLQLVLLFVVMEHALLVFVVEQLTD